MLRNSGILHGTISRNKKAIKGELDSDSVRVKISPASGSGTKDYEELKNKPQIESVELVGNKTFEELGLESIDNEELMSLLTF